MKRTKISTQNQFFIRYVTSYSFILLAVLFIGLFAYYHNIHNAKESEYDKTMTLVKNEVASFDLSLRLLGKVTTQMASNQYIRSLAYAADRNSGQYNLYAFYAKRYLAEIFSVQEMLPIDNCYIYLIHTDRMLSYTTFTDPKLYYEFELNFNMDKYALWHSLLSDDSDYYEILPLHDYHSTNNLYLYKIPMLSDPSTNSISAIVCFEISTKNFSDAFRFMNSSDNSVLYVQNSDGTALFHVNGQYKENTSAEDTIQTYINSDYSSSFRYAKTNYTATTYRSPENGWSYSLLQPTSEMMNNFSTTRFVYILAIVFSLLASFTMIYLISKKNAAPVVEMNDKLKTSLMNNEHLALTLRKQQPLVFHSYLSRICKGLIANDAEASEIAAYLGIDTKHQKFCILYASVYLEQLEFYTGIPAPSLTSDSMDTLSDYRDYVYRGFRTVFGEDVFIYSPDVNIYVLIIGFDADTEVKNDVHITEQYLLIQEKFISVHNLLLKEHSIWLYGGLGNANARLPYFWKSYQQAMEATSYVREGNIFQIYSFIERTNDTYYYPFEMAQQLSNFIRDNNSKQVHEIFMLIQRENFSYRNLSINVIKWLLSDIRNTLVKILFSVNVSAGNEELLSDIDHTINQALTLEVLENISVSMCALFESKQVSNQLIVKIQEYIRNNYTDPSLGLKKISETFDISESYFSYLFKLETGHNFFDYLEQTRMEQALILVKTSDVSLTDLYLKVGYNNVNTFRRAFKKVHGVSPKTIRDAAYSSPQ